MLGLIKLTLNHPSPIDQEKRKILTARVRSGERELVVIINYKLNFKLNNIDKYGNGA
jgi:hypothetical protein